MTHILYLRFYVLPNFPYFSSQKYSKVLNDYYNSYIINEFVHVIQDTTHINNVCFPMIMKMWGNILLGYYRQSYLFVYSIVMIYTMVRSHPSDHF